MDHIAIPHIHQYISTASMPAPMVLLRRLLTVLFTLFNIDTISVGVTPPLGHLELNLTDPTHYFFPFCTCVYRIAKPKLSVLRHVSVDSCNC